MLDWMRRREKRCDLTFLGRSRVPGNLIKFQDAAPEAALTVDRQSEASRRARSARTLCGDLHSPRREPVHHFVHLDLAITQSDSGELLRQLDTQFAGR